MRRPKDKRTGLGGLDDNVSNRHLTSSGGWDIVNEDSDSSDGSVIDDEGGGGSSDIYSYLFGPSSTSAIPKAKQGRGYRLAGDRNSGLGTGITSDMGMGMGGSLPVGLHYLVGLTGWPQQQEQRNNNNLDGWDDDDSNASRYS